MIHKAPGILRKAIVTLDERGAEYDSPGGERSMAATVTAFNAATGHELTETEGWLFMAQLKLVRAVRGASQADSFLDGASYFALAGEAANRDSASARGVMANAESKTEGELK